MVLLLGNALDTHLFEIKSHLLPNPSSAQPGAERQRGCADPDDVALPAGVKLDASIQPVFVQLNGDPIAAAELVTLHGEAARRIR
jgi:hypothetical protein